MTRSYVITVDNGEITGLVYELINCEQCLFLQNHILDGSRLICTHPRGMAHPELTGFCSYAALKSGEEAHYE